MSNEKANVAARLYIRETRTGNKISLDDVCFDLSSEEYERLLTSYNTKKFKYMNDDETISDICKFIFECYGSEDLGLEEGSEFIVSYPIEITNGLSFDDLQKSAKSEDVSGEHLSDWLPEGRMNLYEGFDEKIELCDGNVAFFNNEKASYICTLAWLGREIKIMIYSSEISPEAQIESVKKAFENFLTNKSDYLNMCQKDIVETLLPYIAENNTVSDLRISADDFYADYSLNDVYLITGEGFEEMQVTFINNNGEDIISVHRDLNYGCIIEFSDGFVDIYADDMGL